MRRFLVTSSLYTGEAELVYDSNNCIASIQMIATNMTAEQRQRFKAAVPATISLLLKEGNTLSSCTVVEAEFEVNFEMWWKKYDKKINKARCIPLFNKLSKTEQVQDYMGIDAYDAFLKEIKWRSKADPETYLRNRYWENEYK